MNKKIVIITGGAQGLGLELSKLFIKDKYLVCAVDINQEKLDEAKKELGDDYLPFLGNIAKEETAINVVKKMKELGTIEVLINNGGSPSFKDPTEYSEKDVLRCFEGLYGMIFFSTHVLKAMEHSGGKIINIMSSAALRGNEKESVYCATKWGERGYTESLKVKYNKDSKIHIYGVYPGGIDTNFYKDSHDYVSIDKQHSFMSPKDVALTIYNNLIKNNNLYVDDLVMNRIKR